jgi:uncharacterized alpha-E superfamily protein
MLSRTAEGLFWIGRYLERAESLARVVDIAYHSRLERVGVRRHSAAHWQPLLAIGGQEERFSELRARVGARATARFLTFDPDNPNSILSCVRNSRENARGMRDRITSEMWETLNSFYLWLSERSLLQDASEGNLHALYAGVKERCHLFHGVAHGTMLRDEGWDFLRVGKYLERAAITGRILEVQFPQALAEDSAGSVDAVHQWTWLLRSVSAYEAYRKAFHFGIRPELVAEFLVYHRAFPRSIRFAVGSAEASLKRVSESPPGRYADDAERVLGWLHARLTYAGKLRLTNGDLDELLREIQARCAEVSKYLVETYFAYKVPGANQV